MTTEDFSVLEEYPHIHEYLLQGCLKSHRKMGPPARALKGLSDLIEIIFNQLWHSWADPHKNTLTPKAMAVNLTEKTPPPAPTRVGGTSWLMDSLPMAGTA
jgi:hypothetical protein